MTNYLSLLLAVIALGLPAVSHATSSNDNCTGFITSVPVTISTPGTWCLNQNLSTAMTDGFAIEVNASNVIIDCNGFEISTSAGTANIAYGVEATDMTHITVRRCGIRGFEFGIYLAGTLSSGHVIEDNRLTGNTLVAIDVWGDGSVVRRNLIKNTGGRTVGTTNSATGISASGDFDIEDNTISGIFPTGNGSAKGINAFADPTGSIINNRIRNLVATGTGVIVGIGVYNANGERSLVRDNDVSLSSGQITKGIYCTSANARAQGNVVGGFTTLMENCSDAGGNDLTP